MQTEECMGKVLSVSHLDAYEVAYELLLLALLIFINTLFVFGVFTGYKEQGASILAMTTDKI